MKTRPAYILLAVVAAVLSQACTTVSNQPISFEPGTLDPERYVPKVDQFVVIMDGSMTMADRVHGERKIGVAGSFLSAANQTLPALGYDGGLRTFGKGLCGSKGRTLSVVEPGEYISSAFGDGIARIQCPGGSSPLHLALGAAGDDLTNKNVPTAIVIVSDGLHQGAAEVAAAQALKTAFGDRLDIYAVQVGETKKGRRLLEQVVKAGGDGYVKSAHDLATSEAMAAWVVDVFLYPDDDGDGVPNHLDQCPGTPKGVAVDTVGCPLDTDGDGVPDYLDKCPGTPAGVKVDANGCPLDSDGDGVPDYRDKCPGTPAGTVVDEHGCPPPPPVEEWVIEGNVLFATDKAVLSAEASSFVETVAAALKEHPQHVVEVRGHTDSTGPMRWNMLLSQMRADAVVKQLVKLGVAAERLTTKALGPNEPVAPNTTREGRAKNRRTDFKASKP
jgi:OOP family OmpA-OmpF porin